MYTVPEKLRLASNLQGSGTHICQLLILPSFENSVSWDVTETRAKENQPRWYRTCWRRDIDLEAFRSPVERLRHPRPYRPTIEAGWYPIDPGQFGALIEKFRATPIPLDASENIGGVDGTTYELAFSRYFTKARIRWWARMPEAWKPLEPIVIEMFELFEATWNRGPHQLVDREVIS